MASVSAIAEVLHRYVLSKHGCFEWAGAVGSTGYGGVNIGSKRWTLHRLAWTQSHGQIPDGMCVLHRCDNRLFFNVDHLFLGTKQDNYDDMRAKGRDRKARGTANGNAKLDAEGVIRIREASLFGARQVDLAAAYGVGQTKISGVVRRETWKHVEVSLCP